MVIFMASTLEIDFTAMVILFALFCSCSRSPAGPEAAAWWTPRVYLRSLGVYAYGTAVSQVTKIWCRFLSLGRNVCKPVWNKLFGRTTSQIHITIHSKNASNSVTLQCWMTVLTHFPLGRVPFLLWRLMEKYICVCGLTKKLVSEN